MLENTTNCSSLRKREKNLKIAIVGPSKVGKDLVGQHMYWLINKEERESHVRYASASTIMLPLVAAGLGISKEEAWDTRHSAWKKWFDWANAYRKNDPTVIVRYCMDEYDIVTGFRDGEEISISREKGILDLVIYMRSDRVPSDPTLVVKEDDCDITITNNGSIEELKDKVKRLVSALNI